MPRQQQARVENNFSKGFITSATGFNFPPNSVTTTDNCVFDFTGSVTRREGFDLEQGNVAKSQAWSGQAISSYLWHNVTGDNTLNIYVVQIGSKLFFYPISNAGAAISPQIDSALPLDFTQFSSQALTSTNIGQATGTPIGDLTGGGGIANSFDSILNQNATASSNDDTVGSANPNNLGSNPAISPVSHYVGKDYGGSPQKIGTATIYPSQDLGHVYLNYVYAHSQELQQYHWTHNDLKSQAGVNISCLPVTPDTDTGAVFQSNVTVQTTPTVTVNLRAKNTVAPVNSADGTILGTSNWTGGALTISSNDVNTSWRYIWFEVIVSGFQMTVPPTHTTNTYVNGSPGTCTIDPVNALVGTVGYYTTIDTYSAVSINELITVSEAQFFSPTTSVTSVPVAVNECQFASGLGFLFVSHPFCYPFVVQYTAGTPPTYTGTAITIQVRDFDGVDDGLQLATGLNNNINYRPPNGYTIAGSATTPDPRYNGASYTILHLYNLENQGWSAANLNTWLTAAPAGANVYPSNTDVWWYLKNTSGVFTPANINNINVGLTAAPSGHFIYDAFYQDRGNLVAGTSLNGAPGAGSLGITNSGGNRPSTTAFFSGRAWYSGVGFPNFSNNIWFSQVLSPTSSTVVPSLGQCYQSNDPTSDQAFGLLATDGGVIRIPDCGTILKLFPMHGALIVLATNGIWVVSGSKGGLGFTADDYSINRISAMTGLSSQVVDVMGQPFFWTNEGIYTIKTDIQSGGLSVQSLTYSTIDEFYKDIPRSSKIYARGAYNPVDYTVQWLYRSTAAVNLPDDAYKFDSILVFNTLTGAFYKYSVATGHVNLASIVSVETGLQTDIDSTKSLREDGTFELEESAFTSLEEPNPITRTTYTYKYFVTYSNNLGVPFINIADNFSTYYLDWFSYDSIGQSYTSTFTSGYSVIGEGQRRGIPDYIYVYEDGAVPNSYKLQSIRDYGSDRSSGKWSAINVYTNTSTHFSNFIRRHKLRGRGLVIQFKVTSQDTKPFRILGWSVWVTQGAQP